MSDRVKVRIHVTVDEHGNYRANCGSAGPLGGWFSLSTPSLRSEVRERGSDTGEEENYYLEAELPVPASKTFRLSPVEAKS